MNKLINLIMSLAILILNESLLAINNLVDNIENFQSRIAFIKNFSKFKAFIFNKNIHNAIGPSKKKVLLKNYFNIPFISIKNYIKKFIKDIPYAPSQAIKIQHNGNIFYLWQNELGIIIALDPENIESISNWKSEIVYSRDKIEKLNKINKSFRDLKFILLITDDSVSLRPC